MKVPLPVSWLQENGLLEQASRILGYAVIPDSSGELGVQISTSTGPYTLYWETDSFLFTLGQLFELGFETGDCSELWHAMQMS